MQQQITSQVNASTLAHAHKLGSLRTTHALYATNSCTDILTILFSLLFLSTLFLLLPAMQQSKDIFSTSNPLVFALIFPGVGLFMLIRLAVAHIHANERRGSSLLLYTHGLILLQYEKRKLVFFAALHWQDVALVWHTIEQIKSSNGESTDVNTRHTYSIQDKQDTMFGGDSFKFTIASLGKIVEQETTPYLWPSIIDSYQRGLPVNFGMISISSGGIHCAEKLLPWQEVKEVRFNRTGIVTIKRHGDSMLSSWAQVPDTGVSNIHLLSTLLDFICNNQGPVAFSLVNKRY